MLNFRRDVLNLSLIACAALSSAAASAAPVDQQPIVETIKTRIFKVEKPSAPGAPFTVLSSVDGRVYTIPAKNAELADKLSKLSGTTGPVLNVSTFNDEVVYIAPASAADVKTYSDPISGTNAKDALTAEDGAGPLLRTDADGNDAAPAAPALPAAIVEFQQKQGYTPTILPSMAAAQELFSNVERDLNHDSQCHQRAMVWTHDMFVNRGIKSFKVMMFYTPEFRYNFMKKNFWGTPQPYKWWYHTAPMVYVLENGAYSEVVLDREFLDKAVTLDDWSYFFLHDEIAPNGRNIPYVDAPKRGFLSREETHCKVMGNFREYAIPALRNQNAGAWCMVRKYPMFYMQPADIAAMDCKVGAIDPNYTAGLTGGKGADVLDKKINDGKDYYYNCSQITLTDFRKWDLENAYGKATQR